MGQKIHPLGFRVGITKKHKAKWFANLDQYPQFLLEDVLLRKLVTSFIPPENLPRMFEDDKKMRVVEIQIERFISNTIKIKLYAVNPDLSSLMVEQKRNRDFSSEENSQISNKKNRKINIDKNAKKEKELSISNENGKSAKFSKWKNVLTKKIFELKSYQFKNLIKKFNILLELADSSNKTKSINNEASNEIKLTTKNIFLKFKQLSEKRHKIKLFLHRRLTNDNINLQLPSELDIIKMNLLYIYYNLQIYKINLEMFELQQEILEKNPKIFHKYGLSTKKSLHNLRTIKRILNKIERQYENFQKEQKPENYNDLCLQYPEILLRNYLQFSLKKQYTNQFIKYKRRLENGYITRFGNKLTKKRPIDLLQHLDVYFNWHSTNFKYEKSEIRILNKKTQKQKKPSSFFSSQQLGQKLYLQKKKNSPQTVIFTNNELKQKNIRIKKIVKRKIQHFMIDNVLRKNAYDNYQFDQFRSNYQIFDFSKFITQLTLKNAFPKISSIEIIEVKQPSEYAFCLANFITQKLEKRFSFRSVMKQAKRVAIQTPSVKGVKIQLAGRLNGAEIARTEWIREGRVPLQTLDANVDYSYKTAQTLYGIIGVKVWVFRKKTEY